MSKLTTSLLMMASHQIGKDTGKNVTAIQFEDGSGHKYNYQLEGGGPWVFVDLGKKFMDDVELTEQGYEAALRSREYDVIQHAFKHKLAGLDEKMAQDFMHMLIMLKMK